MTTADVGLLEASDEEQLVYAASQQRALVTHNITHFPGVHVAWVEASREHWGVIILIGHSAVSAWLRRMDAYALAESFLGRRVTEPVTVPGRRV